MEDDDDFNVHSQSNSISTNESNSISSGFCLSGNVLSFSRDGGDFEWTGPACMNKKHLTYCSQNVFNMFEPFCPMKGIKVRAYDIDTYNDYIRVAEMTKNWKID